MHQKEGWAFGQIIEVANPTIIFWKTDLDPIMPELRARKPPEHWEKVSRAMERRGDETRPIAETPLEQHLRLKGRPVSHVLPDESIDDPYKALADMIFTDDVDPASREPRAIGMSPALAAPFGNDPINPKHYGGTHCAEIGELLTANSYQVLKYNWRLGEKDNPCIELGKAIWYLDREMQLHGSTDRPRGHALPEHGFFDARLRYATGHAKAVARVLISWNRYGNIHSLRGLRKLLQAKLDEMNGCTEWGRGQQP